LLPTEEALLLPRTLAGLGVAERLAELGFADLRSYLTARYVGKHVAEVEIGRELLGHPAVWSIRAGLRALGIRRRYRVHHPERPQPVGHLEDGTPYFAPLAELRYDADVDRVQCHLCAAWFRHLTWSHLLRHGWSTQDYLEAFGLNLHRGLFTPTLARRKSEVMKARMASDPRIQAGMSAVQALARDPTARAGWQRRGRRSLEGRLKSGRGLAARRAVQRQKEEELAAHKVGFADFQTYWRSRRRVGWSAGRIAAELGRTDWWARQAMQRIEGSRRLPEAERRRGKSQRSRELARRQADEARIQAEERARAMGFEQLLDYLLDRRVRGWGQARIARELEVGNRRALRLLQSSGLWSPNLRYTFPAGVASEEQAENAAALQQLGSQLRARREALGWSLREVAQRAGISTGLLSLIERGRRRFSLRTLARIRGSLGIEELLLGGPGERRGDPADQIAERLESWLSAVRPLDIAELSQVVGYSPAEVQLGLRRLATRRAPKP